MCSYEEISNHIRWEGKATTVIVNHNPAAILVAINSLASLALSELKTIPFQGTYDSPYRNVAQEGD